MTVQEEHIVKLKFIEEMPDRYDYSSYRKFCLDNDFELMSFPVYAHLIESDIPTIVANAAKSVGLGDTIAKITHATGMDKLAELYTKITGRDCGCTSRQEALNKLVPYGVKEDGV
jgi:hypothetical protein